MRAEAESDPHGNSDSYPNSNANSSALFADSDPNSNGNTTVRIAYSDANSHPNTNSQSSVTG
jgi:hypothetical protein